MLVVNKTDLEQTIDPNAVNEICKEYGIKCMYVSAKNNDNITELFDCVVKTLCKSPGIVMEKNKFYNLRTQSIKERFFDSWCSIV